ncbi:hypothetical protein [Microcoleus sp. CAWBG58]|uniref:hypothetical protein n=1 Tax=Microcoleus sp. CAWBG58 TaxID=2841651 RepID=UPI0025D46794|nr:hypothetical protein [Microcoleus sp. CAWBG58]
MEFKGGWYYNISLYSAVRLIYITSHLMVLIAMKSAIAIFVHERSQQTNSTPTN